jgi:hypothetical protein
MSAWYVLSAMGFYPVLPGSDAYVIGTPLFEKVRMHLENGHTFTINAPSASAQKPYIRGALLNGKPYAKSWFSHAVLTEGGELTFDMSDQPSGWGAGISDRPVSEITEEQIIPAPFVSRGEATFRDRQTIALECIDPEASIRYNVIRNPVSKEKTFKKPFEIKESTRISFQAVKDGKYSAPQSASFHQLHAERRVLRYNTSYNPQYTGGGDEALIDGISGGDDFRTGEWQGFEGVNLDVVIDLGKKQKINRLSAHFLQDEIAWIFFPTTVQFETSDDGEHFSPAGEVVCPVAPTEKGVLQHDFQVSPSDIKARYIRVIGVSLGQCPPWHKGAGHPCWVFADEVEIE